MLKKLRELLSKRREPAAVVSAKIIHADGTVEDMGVIGTGQVHMETKGR